MFFMRVISLAMPANAFCLESNLRGYNLSIPTKPREVWIR